MERQCWMNQAIKPVSQAGVALTDHGLLYGDGVFEGVRFYHRVPFLLTEHLERLFQSAKRFVWSCRIQWMIYTRPAVMSLHRMI